MNTLRSISFINLGYKVHTNNKQTYHSPFGTSLSILQLVENRIMDIKIASLLWFLAKQKASFIVAAPPRLAGKTTVLNSILQLILIN